MAGQKPMALIGGRQAVLPAGDWVLGAGDLYLGTTQYQAGQTRQFLTSGTTDANGRITVIATTTGATTGTALFSNIAAFSAIARTSAAQTDATTVPYFFVETVSTDLKTIVFRAITGRTALLTIGLNYSTTAFAGAGLTASIQLVGLP